MIIEQEKSPTDYFEDVSRIFEDSLRKKPGIEVDHFQPRDTWQGVEERRTALSMYHEYLQFEN